MIAALLYMVLAQSAAATGNYVLTVELPARLRKGAPATLLLHVHSGAQPVDRLAACLATAPLFPSMEDALDTTPANGIDLGAGPESGLQPGCSMAIAGVPSGPGIYAFTWEPDTAGRVNLKFTAGASAITVPADVDSAPPSPVILAAFVVFVALVFGMAAYARRRRPEAAAP
ncbi:MAG: hypothetical protein ACLQVN_19290 [Bryobacteraceae bacterium]